MMNNYILEYYQGIEDGSIVVGHFLKTWYEYVVKGLENKFFFYSPKSAKKAIRFSENFCRHSQGNLGGQLVKLELWQKALISVIFGVLDGEGNRQFREVIVIIGRKNGKTLLAAAISAYCAYCDGEYGGRIYFAAPKLEQANLCFDAFQQMIYTEPILKKMSNKRRTDIYIAESNTSAKPLAFNAKKSDGLNISLAIADEVASWQGDAGLKFYEVLKSSFGSRKQPLLFNISTAGYCDEGAYDELLMRATRLLNGDSRESRLAPFLYIIDDPKKWNDINELQKSNPNLGVSVSVDYLLEEIAVAEQSLSKKGEFLTKYCNIKQNSSQAWLSAVDVENACGAPLNLEDFRECYAVAGLDLSMTTDLTAAVLVIEKNGIHNVFAKFFLPAEKIEEATARDGIPYNIYIKRGFLQISGNNQIDTRDCYNWLVDMIEKYQIYPLNVGYDPYNAFQLTADLEAYGFHMTKIIQGYNLTPDITHLEGLIKDRKINIGDNDLLKIHLLNTALKMENDMERFKITKISKNDHIDGCAALLDAITARALHYNEIDEQLKNEE